LIHAFNLFLQLELDFVKYSDLFSIESRIFKPDSFNFSLSLFVLFLGAFQFDLELLDFGLLSLDPLFSFVFALVEAEYRGFRDTAIDA